jgi:hypothetical protein
MNTGSRGTSGSGSEEKEVSMSEVLSRLKSIEETMRSIIPLKDQVTALETAITEQGQQLQLLSTSLLRVERGSGTRAVLGSPIAAV